MRWELFEKKKKFAFEILKLWQAFKKLFRYIYFLLLEKGLVSRLVLSVGGTTINCFTNHDKVLLKC